MELIGSFYQKNLFIKMPFEGSEFVGNYSDIILKKKIGIFYINIIIVIYIYF